MGSRWMPQEAHAPLVMVIPGFRWMPPKRNMLLHNVGHPSTVLTRSNKITTVVEIKEGEMHLFKE